MRRPSRRIGFRPLKGVDILDSVKRLEPYQLLLPLNVENRHLLISLNLEVHKRVEHLQDDPATNRRDYADGPRPQVEVLYRINIVQASPPDEVDERDRLAAARPPEAHPQPQDEVILPLPPPDVVGLPEAVHLAPDSPHTLLELHVGMCAPRARPHARGGPVLETEAAEVVAAGELVHPPGPPPVMLARRAYLDAIRAFDIRERVLAGSTNGPDALVAGTIQGLDAAEQEGGVFTLVIVQAHGVWKLDDGLRGQVFPDI